MNALDEVPDASDATPYRDVRVGVAVIIPRGNRILLGERFGSHGADTWATPGGHLEAGESIEQCARREVLEETGLVLGELADFAFTNDRFDAQGHHYVTLFLLASDVHGEPRVLETEKCRQWRWCDVNDLPSPLFLPLQNLLAKRPASQWLASVSH